MADSFVMMAVGPYRFSLETAAYQELERSSSWRWASVDRIGARSAQQYVGPGDDTITLHGCIYPHFRGGLGQVALMREAADMGVAHHVVDGTGRVWGNYVITDVREGQRVFFSNGAPRQQDFDITLKMDGDQ
jgi:phage protein U